MNSIKIFGKLGKDADLKYTPSGTPCLEFSVATTESYKKDGKWCKHVEWFSCTWWGESAERQADYMKKGVQVLVQGKQRTSKWDDKDGNKREAKGIKCDHVNHITPFPSKQPENKPENKPVQDQKAGSSEMKQPDMSGW